MKFVRDQKFYWREPYAFARARAASDRPSGKLRQLGVFFVLFALALLFVRMPETLEDAQFVLVFSTIAALFVAFALIPIASALPNGILVASNRVVAGGRRIMFTDIASAVVGSTTIRGATFPVLAIRTVDHHAFLIGLASSVNQQELAAFLQASGIREPQA